MLNWLKQWRRRKLLACRGGLDLSASRGFLEVCLSDDVSLKFSTWGRFRVLVEIYIGRIWCGSRKFIILDVFPALLTDQDVRGVDLSQIHGEFYYAGDVTYKFRREGDSFFISSSNGKQHCNIDQAEEFLFGLIGGWLHGAEEVR